MNPLAEKIQKLDDVERQMPGYLDTMLKWFRVYKIPDVERERGDGRNEIAMGGRIMDREYAFSFLLFLSWMGFCQC